MPIQAGSTYVLEIKLNGLRGEPAADGYLIYFDMQAQRILPSTPDAPALAFAEKNLKEWRFSNPYATVRLRNGLIFIGRAHIQSPLHIFADTNTTPIDFFLELHISHQTMEAIERERNGQDLPLVLDFYGDLFDGYGWTRGYHRLKDPVDQNKWVAVLEQAKYGANFVFEVPLSMAFKANAKAIDDALKSARKHLLEGNYREVIADCRVALEPVKPEAKVVREARGMLVDLEEKEKLSKEQREMLMLASVKDYTELSHHITGDGKYQQFTRQEALLVLGTTLGVLTSLAERAKPAGK